MALPEVIIDFDPEVVIRTKFRAYLDAAEAAGEDAKAQAEQFVADMKEKAGAYIQGQIDEAQKCLDQIKIGYDNVESACQSLGVMVGNMSTTAGLTVSYAAATATALTPATAFASVASSVTSTASNFTAGLLGQVSGLRDAVGSLSSPLARLSNLFLGFGAGVEFPDSVPNPIKVFYDTYVAPLSDDVSSLDSMIGAIPLP